jgi:hypothetical protein
LYLSTISSLFNLLSLCCSWIRASESCCYIRSTNFSIVLCQGLDFWLLCINSTCEFCIFNLTLFSLGVLLQIVSALLCFTNLHFMRNNWCCMRCSMAYMSLFYPWISLLYLKNSSRYFKSMIYLIYTQIVVNGSVIFHLFL